MEPSSAARVTGSTPSTPTLDPCVKRCMAELRAEFRTVQILSIGVFLLIASLAAAVAPSTSNQFAVHVLGAVLAALGLVVCMAMLGRRRWIPSQEMLLWQADRVADAFLEIDRRRTVPLSNDEILSRIEGKTGPSATFQRMAALAALSRTSEAMVVLDNWLPTDSVERCRRERMAARIDQANSAAHLGLAEAAMTEIQDPGERTAQQAMLTLDKARVSRNEIWPGLDALAAARAELGPFYSSARPITARPIFALTASSGIPAMALGGGALYLTEQTDAALIALWVCLAGSVAMVFALRRMARRTRP
jgi:hypothetical protein